MKRKFMLLTLGALLVFQSGYILYDHFNPPEPREVPDIASISNEPEAPTEASEMNMPLHIFHSKIMNTVKGGNINLSRGQPADERVNYEFTPNPFSEYLAMNPDFTGWINVDGTNIDHPIVKGRDNSYYLDNNFYNEPDSYGAIFMDYRNLGNGHDDHTLIYGHHTDTGHMFADFEKYLTESFYEENKVIEIQDLYKKREYEIISVHIGPADLQYINEPFKNDGTKEYGEFLQGESLYESSVDIEEDAKLLTLISCNYTHNDGRLYIHAVEVTG